MRVGVIDVGSNTIRLLVAERRAGELVPVDEEKAYVGLGAEILRHGTIRPGKLAEAVSVAAGQAKIARAAGVERLEIVVAAPGRQAANADELVSELARATRAPVVALTADEEAGLAYAGAVALSGVSTGSLAVCDVGGGSTEVAVGAPPAAPSWQRSVDVGALRLAAAWMNDDPPAPFEIEAATAAVSEAFAGVTPPRPRRALAVGGSARALAKLVGPRLGERELDAALVVVARHRAAKLAKAYAIDPERARLLAAGAVILREVARRLGVPLELGRGGLREGVALSLLAESRAA
jgi:exopolyphosphatase / guanosine-5'-triphosphate,3'-diphosphate pyrophosphatase